MTVSVRSNLDGTGSVLNNGNTVITLANNGDATVNKLIVTQPITGNLIGNADTATQSVNATNVNGGSVSATTLNTSGAVSLGSTLAVTGAANVSGTLTTVNIISSGFSAYDRTAADSEAIELRKWSPDSAGVHIGFYKSRSGTVGTRAAVQSGDDIGLIRFWSTDGTSFFESARITAETTEATTATSSAGRLLFSTTGSGAVAPPTRMTIQPDGSILRVIPGGTTLYPDFSCRAWAKYNGSGVLSASGNVTSVTDNGVGLFTVNLTTGMPDADYSIFALAQRPATNSCMISSIRQGVAPTTTTFSVATTLADATLSDPSIMTVGIFR